jgi:aryl-alcohol dehydrogenase-like predicted oxidoreductase
VAGPSEAGPFEGTAASRTVTPLSGRATPEGTQRFRERAVRDRGLPVEHFREAPGSLTLSSLGLGTYIGAPDGPTDLAVEHAVAISLTSSRANVIDTAINYRYQRAERSIGRALAHLVDQGTVQRDEVFVSTKNGYFAPDGESSIPPERWVEEELVARGRLDPRDIVDGSHAMSPSYLTDQFERSRRNLGVDSVDLLYLHNAPDAQLSTVGREEFLARLEAAFRLYESWRDAGALSFYGLATWDCLRTAPTDPGFFALESAVRLARKVGGQDHGFRFVQFPFNVAMPEAASVRNQPLGGERVSLFDAAAKLRLACFTSVPLLQGRLAKGGPKRHGLTAAQTALQFARSAPHTLAPLVGAKRPEHLSENLELAGRRPWTSAEFSELLR